MKSLILGFNYISHLHIIIQFPYIFFLGLIHYYSND